MSKRKSFVLGFAAACLCFAVIYNVRMGISILSGIIPVDKKISVIERLVEENYVDDVSRDELEEYIYKGYIAGLGDKYSSYMTAEEFTLFRENLDGSYSGIGIQISLTDENLMKVEEVYADSPAQNAGILQGDIIYSVGEIDITDSESYLEAVNFIKSADDKFTVKGKHSDGSEFSAEISSENIDIPSVCYALLDGNLGYIRITGFETNTAEQFDEAVKALENIDGLIIDLRNNPGGLLTTVNNIADTILPEGTITYLEYKNGEKKYYESDSDCLDIPLVILVSGNSASASEVLTGAVKDYGAGTIVGTTTYGKGVVQDSYSLSDGSCVKLTVAKYYTPNGVCIHGEGITPDVEVSAADGFSLPSVTNSSAQPDLENDIQLQKAIDVFR
ncbi:MAG: S41 family peptidase [Clostridiales bacterium]|nr:S41 family peptidase [Clostridiales bacterium]